ncbi:MAG: hypothetical protein AAF702_36485 [Chloroflexota bacterium]
MPKLTLSNEFIDETLADKARWFSTLTVAERIAWLDEWTEILLQNNPDVFRKFDDDHAFQGSVCVLRKKQS